MFINIRLYKTELDKMIIYQVTQKISSFKYQVANSVENKYIFDSVGIAERHGVSAYSKEPQTIGTSFSELYHVVGPSKTITIQDLRTGNLVTILNVPKHESSIEQTEGIIEQLRDQLLEEDIDTPDLVKRVWKSGEDR